MILEKDIIVIIYKICYIIISAKALTQILFFSKSKPKITLFIYKNIYKIYKKSIDFLYKKRIIIIIKGR